MSPVLSAIGMNSFGAEQAPLGVLPTHQRLGSDGAPAGEVDDGLVEDDRARRRRWRARNSAAISRRRLASSCIAGRYCSKRSLPLRLATYIARSASRSRSVGVWVRR